MAQIPHAEPGLVCPLHKKDVSEVCHTCPWWTLIRGKDPTSTKEIDTWGCAVGFIPLLLIENAQMARQTGAAVESFRNDLVDAVAESSMRIAERESPQKYLPH